jgi:copper chaperone NosL
MKNLLVLLLLASSFALAQPLQLKPYEPYVMDYDKETRGLVRQMKVFKSPRSVAKITLQNGKKIFFSSPKSMIEFYQQPGRWFDIGVKSEGDFKQILVTDYETKEPINARGAFYVYGSNVTSPAGDDLVPFGNYDSAQKFAKEHNGKRVLAFAEIPEALINLLNGKI